MTLTWCATSSKTQAVSAFGAKALRSDRSVITRARYDFGDGMYQCRRLGRSQTIPLK